MNILYIAQKYVGTGGAEAILRDKCRLLRDAGHYVSVVHGEYESNGNAIEGISEYFCPSIKNGLRWNSQAVLSIEAIIQKEKPDLVDFQLVTSLTDPALLSRVSRHVPSMVTTYSHVFGCPSVKRFFRKGYPTCKKRPGAGCLIVNYLRHCGPRNPLQLLKNYYNRGATPDLYFWRDSTGHEIDILMDHGQELVPIEVKSGQTFASDFLKSLAYWKSLPGQEHCRAALVYGGDSSYIRHRIAVLSWQHWE